MTWSNAARDTPETAVVRIGQALAHPLRVRVLNLLVQGEPFRAGALARRMHVALPLMKKHLLRLQSAQLIATERIDNAVYYRIAGEAALGPIRPLLAFGQAESTRPNRPED
jgi:DNA-binding transcriptional ArsR family regulator